MSMSKAPRIFIFVSLISLPWHLQSSPSPTRSQFLLLSFFFQVGHYLAFIDVFQYLAFRTYLLFLQYVAKYVYWRLNLFTRQSLVEWLSKFRKHQGRFRNQGHRQHSGILGLGISWRSVLCCRRISLTSTQ